MQSTAASAASAASAAPGVTGASAADVTALLALVEVVDLDPTVVEALTDAAAELAAQAGIPWLRRTDDPPVALVRMITKVAIRCPMAGGPHTALLLDRLRASAS